MCDVFIFDPWADSTLGEIRRKSRIGVEDMQPGEPGYLKGSAATIRQTLFRVALTYDLHHV